MTIWIIEPRDPIIVRDGRPFSADPGAWASSLAFPFPSTIAGGIRTRAGLDDNGLFQFTDIKRDRHQLEQLKQLGVRGPLLVELTASGDIEPNKWLFPAPCDALLLEVQIKEDGKPTDLINQLVPLELPEGAQTDLDQQGLWFIGQVCYDKRKPYKKAPHYWYWQNFQTWLQDPLSLCKTIKHISKLGIDGPISEQRFHVSIDVAKETARDGMLFGTSGLEFTSPEKHEQSLQHAKRLALAVAVDNSRQFTPRAGLAGFGGERRLVSWRESKLELPLCPKELEEKIIKDKACRLILLTPAYFGQGYLPTWLCTNAEQHSVNIDIRAITVQRPQVVSGWDLALRKPKPSRRLVPAGTVLFLKLEGSENDIAKWIRATWMKCISDDTQQHPQDHISGHDQDRRDGFGLAVLGTWNGIPVPMQTR
jgi:CRISPR-associated protein Cmr3